MKKILSILLILCFMYPTTLNAETNTSNVKVAFTRDGYVWIKQNETEEKITKEKAVFGYPPSWSFDGKMVLYQKQVPGNIISSNETSNELWVYDLETKQHHKIFYDGLNPKWSPTENVVAFNAEGVLNVSNLTSFQNVALGVADYTWQPNGKGFIVSSSAALHPDGWTNPILYTVQLKEDYLTNPDLTKNVTKLFVIPTEVGIKDVKILSINAGSFTYSPDGKWISFIISPTASWSMDSDMLSVISADGKDFEVIDEVVLEFTPKWAYNKNLLGFIAGGGRLVFGFKNKDLKVTEIPAFNSVNLTPKNYSELGFSWVNDSSLISSRVTEGDWSNDPEKRPKPSLYFVTLDGKVQKKIMNPPKGFGDYDPQYLRSIHKMTWIRQTDIVADTKDLWIADLNGNHAKIWIHDIGLYSFFPIQ